MGASADCPNETVAASSGRRMMLRILVSHRASSRELTRQASLDFLLGRAFVLLRETHDECKHGASRDTEPQNHEGLRIRQAWRFEQEPGEYCSEVSSRAHNT